MKFIKQTLLLLIITLISCFICFSVFAQIPTTGQVAYWPMNGNYNDAGPFGINGTNNASTATTNKFGTASGAMNFANPATPVVQFATLPVNVNLNFGTAQDFSIAFLVLTTSQPHAGGIYDNNLNYGGPGVFMWNSNGFQQINFNFKNGNIGSTNGALPLNVWKHVCCVRAGSALRIYVDGVLNATGTPGTTAPVYNFGGRIGSMFFNSFSPPQYNGHNGKIDELRIYNRALSASEITGLATTTLPLQLGNFTAVKQTAGIQLNWETFSEQNTSHFEIERSSDGIRYTSIGRVNAAGNSTDKRYYSFTDNLPSTGTNFYRLRMMDIDQSFKYSRVIAIKSDDNLITLQLFPNPVTDILQVQIPSSIKQQVSISIADISGRVVYQKQLQLSEGTNGSSIPVQLYASGTYSLIVDYENSRQSKTFIKK